MKTRKVYRHQFVQSYVTSGFLTEPRDLGLTSGGGRKAAAVLVNPSMERPEFDLRLPLSGLGRWADDLLELAREGVAVGVRGSLIQIAGGGLALLIEDMAELDEPAEEAS